MIIQNTKPFEYYVIQQLFNYVNVPRCHTENLSYENIFFPFKYTLLLYSRFYFLGQKYKGHYFPRTGAFAPVAPPPPPSATRLIMEVYINCGMLGKILENLGSWDMCQNVFGQSDCRIFKQVLSLEQKYGKASFFVCWYKFIFKLKVDWKKLG